MKKKKEKKKTRATLDRKDANKSRRPQGEDGHNDLAQELVPKGGLWSRPPYHRAGQATP